MAKSDSKEDTKMDMAQDKAMVKKAFKMHDKQEHKGQHTDLSALKKGGKIKKMCGGGKMKKYAKGGAVETMGPKTMSMDVEKGSNKLTKFGESAVQKRGHTKGKNLGDSGPNLGIQTGKGSKGASTVTSAAMKAVGRNLARAKNQG